jgi:S1-C subfamily serine protease
MNLLDLLIIAFAVAAAMSGYRMGLLTNAGSWIGGGAGLFVGAQLAPQAVELFPNAGALMRLVVTAVVFATAVSLPAALGQILGHRIHWSLPPGGARTTDRLAGLAMGMVGVGVLVWLLVPVLDRIPGIIARQARSSLLAGVIAEATPPPPDATAELQQLVAGTGFPEVFEGLRRSPATGPVPSSPVLSAEARNSVTAATVRLEGRACGQSITGSGFAADATTVVTNAHVVAGIPRPFVITSDSRRLRGQVVLFDDNRDLALVQVPGLGVPPLPLGVAAAQEEGAVFGHPGGQTSVAVSPARIEREMGALGRDIYGDDLVRRRVLVLASRLSPGDSGGPLADRTGRVVGVAFAIAPDRPATAYAVSHEELTAVLGAPRRPTATAGCVG